MIRLGARELANVPSVEGVGTSADERVTAAVRAQLERLPIQF